MRYVKNVCLADDFLKDILAVMVLTNAFSGNLEWQISTFFTLASTMGMPHEAAEFGKSLT